MYLAPGRALAQDTSEQGDDPQMELVTRCAAAPPQAGPEGVYVLNLWPDGVVYYTFNANVSPAQQQVVYDAFAALSANSNVTFVPHTTEPNWVEFYLNENTCGPDGGCCGSSSVGLVGGVQYIQASSCGWETGLLVHEIGHALGMWHEQQRPDRDQYVEIIWTNVPPGEGGNFAIVNAQTAGIYDFPSTMHYAQRENSVGPAAIRVKAPYRRFWQQHLSEARFQRPWLSTGDNWTLSDMYGAPIANLPPRNFSLTAPAPNALVGISWSPAFTWQSAQGALDYRLQVDNDVSFNSPEIDVTTTATSYSGSTSLSPNTLYFWRVLAGNAAGTTACFPLPWQVIYTAATYPATLYVDDSAPPGGDGTSWAAAMRDLKTATETAYASDGLLSEVRVAGGTYKPVQSSTDRTLSFVLAAGCAVRGGYAGYGAPSPDERNIALYPSILSGDLLGNDGPNFANNADNTYHVMIVDAADGGSTLDGFTITAGNANAVPTGVWNSLGGGLFAFLCEPTISNCQFTGNSANGGGGMTLDDAPGLVSACRFTGNRAAAGPGGGLSLWIGEGPAITNCLFASNSATAGGGGVTFFQSSGNIINCTFAGNTAGGGGGVNARKGSVGYLTNCVLWGDLASQGPEIRIFNVLATEPFSTITVANCDVAGGQAGVFVGPGNTLVWGAGNITPPADPLFVNSPGDLHLMTGSPCVNAGDNAAVPPGIVTDLDGNPRFASTVDLGAYEIPAIPGDINGDGHVNVNDLLAVISAWGPCPTPPALCLADISPPPNGDGQVNVNDLLMVISHWE